MPYTEGVDGYLPLFLRNINTGLPLTKDGVLVGGEAGIFHEGGIVGEGAEGWSTRREYKFGGDEWSIGMVDDEGSYRYRLARTKEGLIMATGYSPFFNVIYENDGESIVGCNFSLTDLIRRTVVTYGEDEKIVTNKCLTTIRGYDEKEADMRFRTYPNGDGGADWELLVELGRTQETTISSGTLAENDSGRIWLCSLQEFDLIACFEHAAECGLKIGMVDMDRTLYVGLNFNDRVDFSEAGWLAGKDHRRPTYRSELQTIFRRISPIFMF